MSYALYSSWVLGELGMSFFATASAPSRFLVLPSRFSVLQPSLPTPQANGTSPTRFSASNPSACRRLHHRLSALFGTSTHNDRLHRLCGWKRHQRKLARAVLDAGVKRSMANSALTTMSSAEQRRDLFDEQLDVRDLLRSQDRTEWSLFQRACSPASCSSLLSVWLTWRKTPYMRWEFRTLVTPLKISAL